MLTVSLAIFIKDERSLFYDDQNRILIPEFSYSDRCMIKNPYFALQEDNFNCSELPAIIPTQGFSVENTSLEFERISFGTSSFEIYEVEKKQVADCFNIIIAVTRDGSNASSVVFAGKIIDYCGVINQVLNITMFIQNEEFEFFELLTRNYYDFYTQGRHEEVIEELIDEELDENTNITIQLKLKQTTVSIFNCHIETLPDYEFSSEVEEFDFMTYNTALLHILPDALIAEIPRDIFIETDENKTYLLEIRAKYETIKLRQVASLKEKNKKYYAIFNYSNVENVIMEADIHYARLGIKDTKSAYFYSLLVDNDYIYNIELIFDKSQLRLRIQHREINYIDLEEIVLYADGEKFYPKDEVEYSNYTEIILNCTVEEVKEMRTLRDIPFRLVYYESDIWIIYYINDFYYQYYGLIGIVALSLVYAIVLLNLK